MNHSSQPVRARLTKREKEILFCIGEGLSSRQIAARLIISQHTVSNHRKNMLLKTGVKSSKELIAKKLFSLAGS